MGILAPEDLDALAFLFWSERCAIKDAFSMLHSLQRFRQLLLLHLAAADDELEGRRGLEGIVMTRRIGQLLAGRDGSTCQSTKFADDGQRPSSWQFCCFDLNCRAIPEGTRARKHERRLLFRGIDFTVCRHRVERHRFCFLCWPVANDEA